ncbi:MAG: hypothetical protein NC121_06025 [Blautia sp.]|nr:hypothetical protein [Blautia sp.]
MKEWDEIAIVTDPMKHMVSKVISKIVKKNLDCDADVQLNELNVTDENEKLHVHLNIDAEISISELEHLLESMLTDGEQ